MFVNVLNARRCASFFKVSRMHLLYIRDLELLQWRFAYYLCIKILVSVFWKWYGGDIIAELGAIIDC